jgi:hypothetical protein
MREKIFFRDAIENRKHLFFKLKLFEDSFVINAKEERTSFSRAFSYFILNEKKVFLSVISLTYLLTKHNKQSWSVFKRESERAR